jgi:hypothetical protein
LTFVKDTIQAWVNSPAMQSGARSHAPKNDAEVLLENARKSFMLASKAPTSLDIAHYAAMGRGYLVLAHQAAKIDATTPERSFWDLP